jgi:putative transposase
MARGGKRAGAGRKKSGRHVGGPHRQRPSLSSRHPVHVVLRANRRLSWRKRRTYDVLRTVLRCYFGREDFRIVHLSIQNTHLHLIVEAADERALSLGMQSFTIRAARAINASDGSIGKLFAHRYHASQITNASYARRALSYVLNNWRRHRQDFANGRLLPAKLDPYSSALSFTGWTERFAVPAGYEPLPVSPAKTALLRSGWARYGPLDPMEQPGPLW